MSIKKEKTLFYRRATWLIDGASSTLEYFVRQACNTLATVDGRTIVRNGQYLRCACMRGKTTGGLFLHIVTDTPGESASIVPHTASPALELAVATTTPPRGAEFMDGDAFVHIRDNNVFICTTGLRDGGIRAYLIELFRKARLGNIATQFELMRIANVNKIKLINTYGVKEIDLRATMFEATARYAKRKGETDGVLGVAAKHLGALFGNANEKIDDSLSIGVTLAIDRRRKTNISLGESRIKSIALDLVKDNEYDDYVIITGNGQRISKSELSIRSRVAIKAMGKSVDRGEAWAALASFYRELERSGALEE